MAPLFVAHGDAAPFLNKVISSRDSEMSAPTPTGSAKPPQTCRDWMWKRGKGHWQKKLGFMQSVPQYTALPNQR